MSQSPHSPDAQLQSTESPRLSRAVVDTVAEAEGVDATDLDPLYHAIDPDALDAVFRPQLGARGAPAVTASVTFEYHGYEVRATAAGSVELVDQ